MLEKLLLALAITFCLNLFLQVRLPNRTNSANFRLVDTPISLVKLLNPSVQNTFNLKSEIY